MSNRLKSETSPYLLQHSENPVDWQPWDEKALLLARDSGKPILLSIGYSACHWCHVMAHESFEDPETAELMNRLYVNIKVDREERPDLDRIYQLVHQLYTGRAGGWPLTVFLTPEEHWPIFAGTYFPKERRYGMPAFKDVLTGIDDYLRQNPTDVRARGRSAIDALAALDAHDETFARHLDDTPIKLARARLEGSFDPHNGGFGGAPKFPHATHLEFLLELSARGTERSEPDEGALEMCRATLSRMARSGLYDHLGGGFYRYCVDAAWTIPHFEKMLYDNAALVSIYADTFAATADPDYAKTASETAEWVLRDMQAPDGGFYATLDADSEGEEGKFYVWTREQIGKVLANPEARLVEVYYGLDGPANFEDRYWHLQATATVEAAAEAAGIEAKDAQAALVLARVKLLDARNSRAWPGRDDKRIASWNGLMIAALAKAARRLSRPDFAAAAARAADFVFERMYEARRLKSTYNQGRARFAAYLDDYACLALALLELLQTRWRVADLQRAVALLDTLLERFADPRGGFFFTADDHERLIHRSKPLADESLPSGNGVAAHVMQAFGHLLGDVRYLAAAENTLCAALPNLERAPEAHGSLLGALATELRPPELIVVRGDESELAAWRQELDRAYSPGRLCFFIPNDENALPGLLGERQSARGPVAYVCEGTTCRAPVHALEELLELTCNAAG